MRVKFFAVPALDPTWAEGEVNRFLASHRIVKIQSQLVSEGGGFWALYLTYEEGPEKLRSKKGRIDYRQVLGETDFQLFVQLRNLRKTLAEKDGVPPYAIFNNEQLAAMVTGRLNTLEGLHAVKGVGKSRVENYGSAFLELLSSLLPQQATREGENA